MIRISLVIIFSLMFLGCQKAEETKVETNSATPTKIVKETKNEVEKAKVSLPIDLAKLANKSAVEFDKIFGNPEEVKPSEDGGEYRLYKIADEPKGLAVRFYGGKAKKFNLILAKPVANSKQALSQVFGIDVGKATPLKDPKEPLSEKYQGIFNGVNFSKVSAKKEEKGNGFIFVLAEVK